MSNFLILNENIFILSSKKFETDLNYAKLAENFKIFVNNLKNIEWL